MLLVCNRQLALKALNERLKSVPSGTSWPSMDDDSETAVSGHVSSAVEAASSSLPVTTDVNDDTPDTPAAVSIASSTTSESHEQQH